MITSGQIVTIIILCMIIGIFIAGYIAYRRISRKVRDFSRQAFGTDSVLDGLKKVDKEAEVTPKSLSSATSILLPQITRDFPEFHLQEMKNKAENVLYSYLKCIDEDKLTGLVDGTTSELKEKLQMKVQSLRNADTKEHFKDIKVHRSEIKNYSKAKGRCAVIFQSAVQYHHYKERGGKIVDGSKERLKQAKYEVEMIYIQDRDFVENQADSGLAMNCPNCGAPLDKLGAKKCSYCGTPIMEFNIRIWNFSDVDEV